MGLDAALDGMVAAVNAAIVAAGFKQRDQVGKGEPNAVDLVAILKAGGYQIAVYPLGGSLATLYPAETIASSSGISPLTATVAGGVITFAGSIAAGIPVHIGINSGAADVVYVTLESDTLTSIPVALRDLIDALSLPGVTATAVSDALTVAGANTADVMIATTAQLTIEVARVTQRLQVTVWAPDGATRAEISDAILSRIGMSDTNSVALADGTEMDCFYAGDNWTDQSSGLYSAMIAHLLFDCEFSIVRFESAAEIAAGIITATNGDGTSTTRYTFGGPA